MAATRNAREIKRRDGQCSNKADEGMADRCRLDGAGNGCGLSPGGRDDDSQKPSQPAALLRHGGQALRPRARAPRGAAMHAGRRGSQEISSF